MGHNIGLQIEGVKKPL